MRDRNLTPKSAPARTTAAALTRCFKRSGYVRLQNPKRLARDGYAGYKKGDEVRLTARNREELARIRELLRRAGFVPGRPFLKGRQYRQPVYGRLAVRRFLELAGGAEPSATGFPTGRARTPRPRTHHDD